ncbi:alpha-amylase family glycosyl hydrolase [Profundibacterium mesophilum]|uniref:Alpha-glucosidase n=1 Tax=Profundibacterium mesophilum KAUST100406-0324 TaxID=1037889 RepID=A0A921NT81_9RHOB|nr:alpha-amylase family glycosyl hydrolase [Profundibacterium mesophilum]KAF0677615.1 Alpha-glucosidase [Profundibacterium mesophilum KAUST100406-0324]
MTHKQVEWWKQGVIYQVYPRSFQDSTGNGVGDLRGIERRLPYLRDLGVDAIWISPIFPSPMRDAGYDITDYTGIEPLFGDLEAFDALVDAAHGLGLRVLLDFVPSHSSDQHPWFREAREGRGSRRRDWYIWRDPGPDGGPPNNWLSEFGGPAWTFDAASGQYYLNIYLPEQPALNWRNPDLRAAMLDALRFWFDRGVDGFRVDAAEHIAPDDAFRDNLPNPDWHERLGPARQLFRTYSSHQPDGYAFVREMRAVADAYEGRVLVGEAYGELAQVMRYYGDALDGFHLPFNFGLIEAPWDADHIAGLIRDYEAALPAGGWPNWVLGNHDRARIASRAGPAQAPVAAMLLMTLRGTPTIYQGDELGLENGIVPPELIQDPWERNVPGQGLGRDPVRLPMPWDDGPGRGFTQGTPWLPLSEGSSAEAQSNDPGSMLSLHKRLLSLRRSEPALSLGALELLAVEGGTVLRYRRTHEGRVLEIALNFGTQDIALEPGAALVMSTDTQRQGWDGQLAGNEGVILVPDAAG